MPGEEDPGEDYYREEDEEEWDTSEWEEELPEPMSEDEQFNGVNAPPPAARKSRRRRPPMPRTPNSAQEQVLDPDSWIPPFEVLPDGTVTGPKLGDGDIERLPDGYDPPKGTFEGVLGMFRPPGSRLGAK